jgi:CRISPR-associated protein (Cas_Cmr5)
MKEVSRGKLSDEDVENKFKDRLKHLPVTIQDVGGLDEFDFLKAYTQKKANAWEKIINILKSYLFYNKHNIKDVMDCMMYIAGLKHAHLVVRVVPDNSQCVRDSLRRSQDVTWRRTSENSRSRTFWSPKSNIT